MRWGLNLDDYGVLAKDWQCRGYHGVALVKKVEKELGIGAGVEFGSAETLILKA